jgi:biotin carboxylase
MNLEVIVLTNDAGERRVPDAYLSLADHVEIVDTNDDDLVLRTVGRLAESASIAAVLPGYEYYVPVAARIGTMLGVPALDPEAALDLRFKDRMRRTMQWHGIDGPRFAITSSTAECEAAVRRIGLPCVVKPIDLSGSLYVRKAATVDEALDAFRDIAAQPRDLDRVTQSDVLVEEYVTGDEYSIEGFVEDDVAHVLSVTRKLLGPEPHFVEAGHIVPGDLSPSDHDRVVAYVRRVIRALRLSVGVFHAEVRLSARGPLLMEIAARLPGDRIPDLMWLARGVDLYEIMLRGHLGLSNRAWLEPRRSGWAGIRYFLRAGQNRYTEFVGRAQLATHPNITEVGVSSPPGVDLPVALVGRLGHVIATAPSYEETVRVLEDADRRAMFVDGGAVRVGAAAAPW